MKWLVTILFILFATTSYAADTNTVSSTVVTNNTPPTASAPSVVVNNSDVCKTAASAAIQTQILGLASGMTVTDDIGDEAKVSWEKNLDRIPKKSLIHKQLVADLKQNEKEWNEVEVTEDDYTLSDDKKQKSKHNIIPMVITALAFGVAF